MDNTRINVLSLCSGGGGLDEAVRLMVPNARVICHVERDAFACSVLVEAMAQRQVAPAPIWTDIFGFDGVPHRGCVDFITAGFPCQPFSVAGKRLGESDPRHLWPEVARIIGEVQPAFVFLENVSGLLNHGFGEVCARLEGLGFDVAAGLFTAEEAGCSHKRERVFILAHSKRNGLQGKQPTRTAPEPTGRSGGTEVADAGRGERSSGGHHRGVRGERKPIPILAPGPSADWGPIIEQDPTLEPAFRGVSDGLAATRRQWLRLLGNGVVPVQGAYALATLWSVLEANND